MAVAALPAGALLGSAAVGALGSIFGGALSRSGQLSDSKELFDYQWNKALSPTAQVRELSKAGLNAGNAFAKTPPVNVGSSMPSPSAYPYNFAEGVSAPLRDLTGAMLDIANTKKAGADTSKVEKEVEGQVLSNEAQEMQNKITREFGMPRAALDLATAYEGVLLAQKENDIKEQEKAMKVWETAKAKAESEASEVNRDILHKELANKDKEIELRNKESEARADASRASAEASRASASYSRAITLTENELRDIRIESGRLENSFKDNEINYNVATFQTRVDALKNQLTSYEMDTILKKIEAQDKSAYTTLQRLLYGKGSVNGADAKRALHLFNEVVSSPLGN